MAGGGEWSDSWVLLAHREDPDVEAGQFHLALEVGSRQWGGSKWDLDLSIGRFDEDTGSHDGDITWDLRRSSGDRNEDQRQTAKNDRRTQGCRGDILELLADQPWRLTKTGARDRLGGSRRVFDLAWETLVEDGRITHDKRGVVESGTTKSRPVWGLADNPDQQAPVRVHETERRYGP